jgi:hypothetical protein
MARGLVLPCVGMALVFAALCGSVFADNVTINQDFDDMAEITVTHEDVDPFKGYAYVTVSNSGSVAWGDFHFEIVSYMGSDVSNVEIVDVDPFKPTTDRSPFTYAVDNVSVGSKLDYYFYGDPVGNGETATFTFYTDNTTNHANFGLLMFPTPVPEPATLSLLGLGLGAMLLIRRRK